VQVKKKILSSREERKGRTPRKGRENPPLNQR